MPYHFFKRVNIIILTGDMMTAAEVYHAHIFKIFAELLFHLLGGSFKVVAVLLAKRVEVQTVDSVKAVLAYILFKRSKSLTES